MGTLQRLLGRLRARLRRDDFEARMDEEMRFHLEMQARENVAAGMTAAEARRAAALRFGGVAQIKEVAREARGWVLAGELRRDLALAVRALRRRPGFTAVVATILALGVGANTAIFSVVDAVVFRSLPYRDPGRLVKICGNGQGQPTDDVSLPDLLDIAARGQSFEGVAGDDGSDLTIVHPDGRRDPVAAALVTADWLATLGVRPALGRGFLPEDFRPGAHRVMVVTDSYWRRGLASDPAVVGKTLAVDRGRVTVVGVLPANVLRYGADVLVPLDAAAYPPGRGHRDLDAFARLRAGVTRQQAQAELDNIARRLAAEHPGTNARRRFSLVPLEKYYADLSPRASGGLLLMLGAVGLVLLIACANVASLLLARALTRHRECAIRAALGASRGRLVRQLLVEHLLLFLVGGLLGMALARAVVDALVSLAVAEGYVPERLAIAVDARVLVFGLLLSLVAGLSFGLAPAFQASRVNPGDGLRDGGQSATGGRRRGRARRLLVVSELALSLVLLVGGGLMIRSFLNLQSVPTGFAADNLLMAWSDGGRDFPAAMGFWRTVLTEARALPGVEQVALTSRPPVHDVRELHFEVEGQPPVPTAQERPRAGDVLVSADYFRVLHIPVVAGRPFSDGDRGGAPPVAIVSESLAHRFFSDGRAVGRRIRFSEPSTRCCAEATPTEGVWREIVGVVGDVRQRSLDHGSALTVYRPHTQIVEHDMALMVRPLTAADAPRVAGALVPHLRAIGGGHPWSRVRSMSEVIGDSQSVRLRRFVLILLGGLAALALVLAAVGVYGVIAHAVADRTREIGIRLALGAPREAVRTEVLRDAMGLAAAGLAGGAAVALVLARFLEPLLFEVRPADAATYAVVAAVLGAAALAAGYLPARRAMRVDPMVALRHE